MEEPIGAGTASVIGRKFSKNKRQKVTRTDIELVNILKVCTAEAKELYD